MKLSRRSFSRRSPFWFVAIAFLGLLLTSSSPVQGQQDSLAKRRLVGRSTPAYPALAHSMALAGVVRVEAVVSPDGSVKTVEVKGGHPVLAQAAVIAVRKWRWEPVSHETREPVEVRFDPE